MDSDVTTRSNDRTLEHARIRGVAQAIRLGWSAWTRPAQNHRSGRSGGSGGGGGGRAALILISL